MTILFISNPEEDSHLVPVIHELGRRGHTMQIFNPGAFPLSAAVTVESSRSGPRTFIRWEGQEIDLAQVGSIWYRRPDNFELPEELSPKEIEWLKGEAAALLNGIYANSDALWVSQPHAIRRADFKLLQLRLAQQLGFRVPDYVVTNDPNEARAFSDAHPNGVIIKGLWIPTIVVNDRAGMIYTHRVTAEDLQKLESVRYGPTFFQELVPKRRDIRVTVIGDQLFAAGIDSTQSEAARIDFRKAEIFDLPHAPIELPEPVARACLRLVHDLDLQFGAIDLLETLDGEYVFLENNPNGQWYWVEMITGQPMARAMADLLERGVIERGLGEKVVPHVEPAAYAPQAVPVGTQTVPLSPPLARTLNGESDHHAPAYAATRAWLERKEGGVFLHVGDVDHGADAVG